MTFAVIDPKTQKEIGRTRFISEADEMLGMVAIAETDRTQPYEDGTRYVAAPLIPVAKTPDEAVTSKKMHGNRDPIHHFSNKTGAFRYIDGTRHQLSCYATSTIYPDLDALETDLQHLKSANAYDSYKMKDGTYRAVIKFWRPSPKKEEIMLPVGRNVIEALTKPIAHGNAARNYVHEGNEASIVKETIRLAQLNKAQIKMLKKAQLDSLKKGRAITLTFHKLTSTMFDSDHARARTLKNLDLFADTIPPIFGEETEGSGMAMNPHKDK